MNNDETAKVLDELAEFADQILPAMAVKDPDCFPDAVSDGDSCSRQRTHSLAEWRGATRRLHHILATASASEPNNLAAAEFQPFMCSEASPDYVIADGRTRWRISIFVPMDWAEAAKLSPLPPDCRPKDSAEAAQSVEATKTWMLFGASARDVDLFNCLCTALPCIADFDPAFARNMLDVEAWRDRIQSNLAITESERALELAALDGMAFGNALNNALLHVSAALANNGFGEIHHLIQNPIFVGRYTILVPHYLFAVLFAKVQILADQIQLDAN